MVKSSIEHEEKICYYLFCLTTEKDFFSQNGWYYHIQNSEISYQSELSHDIGCTYMW